MSLVLGVGSGGGAPRDAQYVVLVADATLTQERVLTGTANRIVVTDGGAGLPVTLSPGALIVQTDQANTWTTGTQTINTGAIGTVGLVVKAHAGQTADTVQVQTSAGANLVQIYGDGRILQEVTGTAVSQRGFRSNMVSGANANNAILGYIEATGNYYDNVGLRGIITVSTTNSTRTGNSAPCGLRGDAWAQITNGLSITEMSCVMAAADVRNSNVVTNLNMLKVFSPLISGGGSVTNAYGLNVSSISGATATNYAIYTNAGLVRFGDRVLIDNLTTTEIPLRVQAAAAQTANLTNWETSAGVALMEVEASGELDFQWAMGDSTKDPTTDAPDDWIELKIGGATFYCPAYVA